MLVEILCPPTDALFGSLCLMCSPSEGVGSLIVLLAEADITLDILLLIVGNLAALGLSSPYTTHLLTHSINQSINQTIHPFIQSFSQSIRSQRWTAIFKNRYGYTACLQCESKKSPPTIF